MQASKQDIVAELNWRGLIHQTTDQEELRKLLSVSRTLYAGFDPTADSLHVGSLMPLMLLRRFQRAGHHPIALVGGATGMIGDPSGKSEERNLLSKETLQKNVEGMKAQMKRFLDFDGPCAAKLVNNFDWMEKFSFLDFLRIVGKNVPVNVMLAKDSVRARIERTDSGISYTEFSYMLLQAYDFVHLAQSEQCVLQIGGSDQWGNITAGIDLGRRMLGQELYGLTCPLLLTSDGRKMGKTERGAVWLDANRTSPYAFYQYWINVSDADVLMCLRFLTELDAQQIETLEQSLKNEPHLRAAQKALAEWLTRFIHGEEGLKTALRATEIFFGAAIESLDDIQLLDIFADVPSGEMSKTKLAEGLSIIDAFVAAGLAKSKGEARRSVEQGAAYVNNRRVDSIDRQLSENDLASQTVMVLRSGKRNYALLRFI